LQLRHAFRVTDSGTLRRFEAREELLVSVVSISPPTRRGSDPVLSDVDWLRLLVEALLSPNEGRILRNDIIRTKGYAIKQYLMLEPSFS
jgi:hypothetical protein